jgi:hypothetical protein
MLGVSLTDLPSARIAFIALNADDSNQTDALDNMDNHTAR